MIFVGRKFINNFEDTLSLEYQEITKKKIKFISLSAGRFTRTLTLKSFLDLLFIPIGFFQALKIIIKERPNAILSFGGYLALPIVFWGFLAGIPIYTHEQTISPGLANRIIGFFAKKIFVAFEKSTTYFNKTKTIVVGNPIRESVFKVIKRPFNLVKNRSVIYISGGSLGSHSVNELIKQILPFLLKKFIIIHQIGDTKEYHDYENLINYKNKLSKELQKNYFPKKFFFEEEIGYIYSLADLVVSRAGANTFFELLSLKKPTIFIPLPWSAGKEQELQAKIFKEAGVGEIFYQWEDTSKLLQLIDKMIIEREKYQKNFDKLANLYNKNAAKPIIKEILSAN
ncbi:MAG: UDP-N-acetylglucosamine--N-acetylmuramyl-(pentapeptide) pyrophosphoryl-undecaprenol N-acetylglucosamine transferase [Microgenomates group bacterium]